MRGILGMVLGLAIGTAGLPAAAQQVSDAELLRLFEAQRDAFRAAAESGTGRARGVTLVPLGAGAAPRAEPARPAPTPALRAAPSRQGAQAPLTRQLVPQRVPAPTAPEAMIAAAPPPAATRPVFGQFAPELQVNVRIEFAVNSAALVPAQKPRLEQLCRVMKASDIRQFRIVGHTDASGSDSYNQRLSEDRAEAVRGYFVTECGIDPARLEAVGMGERFLLDTADPDAEANRRVEFQAIG
ncbi:OmpA family protein [Rhodovulum marinum]|nr:OmpA family protein [Rhodovulum marinum]